MSMQGKDSHWVLPGKLFEREISLKNVHFCFKIILLAWL
jgi:hypothetical protein